MPRSYLGIDAGTLPDAVRSRWTVLSLLLAGGALIAAAVSGAVLLGVLAAVTIVNAGLTFAHYRRTGRVPPVRWRLRSLARSSRRQRLAVAVASGLVLVYAAVVAENLALGVLIVAFLWLGTSLWR